MTKQRFRPNIDAGTVDSFGDEWSTFDQSRLSSSDLQRMFEDYFAIFPWEALPDDAIGADIGCGSGRWARLAALRASQLYCVDASFAATLVSHRNLRSSTKAWVLCASVDALPFREKSLDFGYSLGVLHHLPSTADAIRSCVRLLKPGAPFLLYLYYSFENRPVWYRALWRLSDLVRRTISSSPSFIKNAVTGLIAATVYWPLSRMAAIAERAGISIESWPLAHYRSHSLYTMRTDARDRFGTPLEHRFDLAEIKEMMSAAGLIDIVHSERPPFWCVVGRAESKGVHGQEGRVNHHE
jgi:SAM-dependent methyltransferase